MQYTILGFDPGSTKAYSVLDLKGNHLKTYSSKKLQYKDIFSIGLPLIIGTDVTPPPYKVQKLCSETGAILYHPRKNFSILEKNRLISDFLSGKNIKLKNKHEKDSLFAALISYKKYFSLFTKINKFLGKEDKSLNDEVSRIVIKERMPIRNAIKILKQNSLYTQITKKENI